MRQLIGLLFAVAVLTAGAVALDGYQYLDEPVAVTEPTLVQIPDGAGFTQVVARLSQAGVFGHPLHDKYFTGLAMARDATGRIKSGEYEMLPGMRPAQVLEQLLAGKTHQYRLTVVEGWRFSELRAALAKHDAIDATLAARPAAEIMTAIGAAGEHPEGRFLPDTYLFPRGTTDVAFLARAYKRMQAVLAAQWSARADALPLAKPYEALILASIIEKETAVAAERERIAGVFTRRLDKGMPLQTDPTVIYGIDAFDGDLRRSDLERDGPYNTYRRKGLPPTPIALPGKAAIHAALHPAPGDALYFVARGDGTHVFSANYDAHRRAVNEFQKKQ